MVLYIYILEARRGFGRGEDGLEGSRQAGRAGQAVQASSCFRNLILGLHNEEATDDLVQLTRVCKGEWVLERPTSNDRCDVRGLYLVKSS